MKKSQLKQLIREVVKEVYNSTGNTVSFNGKQVDTRSVEIGGVDRKDYPDFSDAYVAAANYVDGTPLSDNDLAAFDNQNVKLVHKKIHDDQLYMQEGEEEKLGSSAYDREDREEKSAKSKKATCRVCHKPFTPSYGEHHRCPSCMNKQHSHAERATGTQ